MTNPLLEEILVHLSHVGVSMAVDWSAVDVEAVEPSWHDEHTDVANWTEINELTNLVLKESLVD